MLLDNILYCRSNYAIWHIDFFYLALIHVTLFLTITMHWWLCTCSWPESWSVTYITSVRVVLLFFTGDGRNDSPGHCAQFCSYTTMELESKKILHVATIDKRQTSWNSNIMEREAFIQTVDKLSKEIRVVEICTDAHVQIAALLSKLPSVNIQDKIAD